MTSISIEYLVKLALLPVSIVQRLWKESRSDVSAPSPEASFDSPVSSNAPELSSTTSASPSIFHFVHFRFYPHIPSTTRTQISQEFTTLHHRRLHPSTQAPYIKSFTGGNDTSIEDLQRGYHVAFILEFACQEDRDFYVKGDEVHKRFGVEILTEVVEEVMVMDLRRGEF